MTLKNIMSLLLISLFINQNIIVNANNKELVEDIKIIGLEDNTTFYVDGEINVEAKVTNNATIKDIEFRSSSKILNLNKNDKNKVIIKALGEGEVQFSAHAMDNSDKSRWITLQLKNYPNDNKSLSLINTNINPIRSIGINNKILEVEANENLSSTNKVKYMNDYLNKIVKLGKLTLTNINTNNEKYDFYDINIRNYSNIRIRVNKLNESNLQIKEMLTNLNKYNNKPQKPLDEENNSEDNKNDLYEEVTQGLKDIIIVDKTNGEKENPIKVKVNENLSSLNKVNIMKTYLDKLKNHKIIDLIDINRYKDYDTYKFRISEKKSRASKNDFYIEIIVDKDDEKSYIPIIEMLDKFKNNDTTIIQDNKDNGNKQSEEDNKDNINNNKDKNQETSNFKRDDEINEDKKQPSNDIDEENEITKNNINEENINKDLEKNESKIDTKNETKQENMYMVVMIFSLIGLGILNKAK